jgi:hypothetical protein
MDPDRKTLSQSQRQKKKGAELFGILLGLDYAFAYFS